MQFYYTGNMLYYNCYNQIIFPLNGHVNRCNFYFYWFMMSEYEIIINTKKLLSYIFKTLNMFLNVRNVK